MLRVPCGQAIWLRSLVLSAALTAVAAPAIAGPITFTAVLNGASEAPPNASPGTGFATVTIDATANTMLVDLGFSGLIAPNTASHIHVINGPGDANTLDMVGPVATTVPTFTGFPSGTTAGTYYHLFDMTLASSYRPDFVTDSGGSTALAEAALFSAIVDGRAYLNIHSSAFPGGEIRGFLAPVPEPASLLLLSTGLAGLVARRRRRQ